MPVRSVVRSARWPAVGNGVGAALGAASGAGSGTAVAARRRLGPARLELGGRSRQDPALQRRRRLDHRHALSKDRKHRSELGHLGMRIGARRQVRPHGIGLVRIERAQHERSGELAHLVAAEVGAGRPGHVGHRESAPTSATASVSAATDPSASSRTRRIASSPRRIRLFTVPRGVAVRSATSTWVKPPK